MEKDRFFHYEPLSTSSFRKKLSIPGSLFSKGYTLTRIIILFGEIKNITG